MRRAISCCAGLVAATTLLAGCAAQPGPLIDGHSEGVACTVADGRRTYVATQEIDNRSSSAMTVRRVVPAGSPNSVLRQTLSGPAMNGLLIVGGYDPTHGLRKLQRFSAHELQPEESMTVVFVSDVVDVDEDAAVEGVRVEYTLGGRDYAGTIPWTYRFNATRCS